MEDSFSPENSSPHNDQNYPDAHNTITKKPNNTNETPKPKKIEVHLPGAEQEDL